MEELPFTTSEIELDYSHQIINIQTASNFRESKWLLCGILKVVTVQVLYHCLYNITMTLGNNDETAFDRHDNDSNDTLFLFNPKILNAIKFIRDRKKRADLEAIFDHLTKMEAYNADKELVENLSSQLRNCKLIINKKTHTGLDSFCLTSELQKEFRIDIDEESQTENQNDVHEENLNEHGIF